ncbi:MAG TPA: AI-2E family transporter [Devosiaceae bacterium]|jgi:predicted PurR-regulated permease PerM
MTLRNQVVVWIGFLLALILVLWVFRGILLPFVIGLALAYLLNPLVGMMGRLGLGRGWATAIVLAIVLVIIGWAMFLLVPLLVQQVIGLAQRLPGYVTDLQALANQWVPALNEWLGPERTQQLEQSLTEWMNSLNLPGITATITSTIAASGASVITSLGLLVIAPVVAFYLLLDWEGMVTELDELLPRDYREEIRGVLNQIDRSMAGVIRGQGSVVLVLCFYYSSALTVSGLSFGLAIGLITGLLSFIPYVGFITGFFLSVGIALVQFWPDWFRVVIILAVFMVGQFLEGNILYPKLVGSSIGINPVWLMFSLFAFALLFGFVGLLLAVPLSAIAAVLTRYAIGKYKASALYLGQDGEHGDKPDTAV